MSRPAPTAFLLSAAGYRVSRGLAAALVPLGLEPRHFGVLNGADLSDGATQTELAQELAIPPSRMVAIIDELAGRGLLERRAHPTDRRARTVHLTAAGRDLLAEARRRSARNEADILEPLSERERATLRRLLAKLWSGPKAHPALHDRA
jgi:DNA-binding MarR family transcriptional regulator